MKNSFLLALFFTITAVSIPPLLSWVSFNSSSIRSKNIIVTGASTGIGEELAYVYARYEANIVVIARSEDKLRTVIENCLKFGAKSANYVVANFERDDDESYEKLINSALSKFFNKTIDVLILNHVVTTGAFRKEGYYAYWNKEEAQVMFNVNFFSYVKLAQFSIPLLEESQGRLVIVGSAAGRVGLPSVALYSSTKHALFGYFDSLRFDFQRRNSNISITTCVLGSIRTENAYNNTAGSVRESMWASAVDCAYAIIRGAELRKYEVYFPLEQTYPVLILRLFPSLFASLVELVM